jgi:hypothetical protein
VTDRAPGPDHATHGSSRTPAMTDDDLDLEFAYTTWGDSCRDLYAIDMCCRRQSGHTGKHAAGFGQARERWEE